MNPVYKYCPDGYDNPTNMLYTPMSNIEGDRLTMIWDENHPYQVENNRISKELVDFFFEREVKHIRLFQNYSWAPKLFDIDLNNRTITHEWNGHNTLNHILYDPEKKRNLDNECPSWKQQIRIIIKDISELGYYKMALYPHCFFLDKNNNIKTFDYYSCLSIEERYLPFKSIEGMVGPDSGDRFRQALVGDNVDFKLFFEYTMKHQLSKTWIDNIFPELYEEFYES